jgi:hypothetical protein
VSGSRVTIPNHAGAAPAYTPEELKDLLRRSKGARRAHNNLNLGHIGALVQQPRVSDS